MSTPSLAALARKPPARAPRPRALELAALLAQLLGLYFVIVTFTIQSPAFHSFYLWTVAAFALHALLPPARRLLFFLLYSLVGIVIVLGPADGAVTIASGLVLIALAHAPVRLALRIALLVASGALLAAMRMAWLPSPVSTSALTLVASMFMFRMVIYLYDRQREEGPPELTRTLSYFFMGPNVCFPLFPVVDYTVFRRNYYDADAAIIYQNGVRWILRGVLHLLAYRYVYYFLSIDPADVDGFADLARFAVSSFLLYLQISGTFHLAVGMLQLFGFHLPETHHYYYLASSFNDFWRRINIYWKDFMLKVVYYPVYFRFRQRGDTAALVVATLVVFFATWVLHAYQWFWLRGGLLLEAHDALFWAILGLLVIVNSLGEIHFGRTRSLGRRARSLPALGSEVLSIAGTFTSICLLWSMWSTDSLEEWLAMWATAGRAWIGVALAVSACFAGAFALSALARRRSAPGAAAPSRLVVPAPAFWTRVPICALGIVAIAALGNHRVYTQLPGAIAAAVETVAFPQLSDRDLRRMEQGYYEKLLAHRNNPELWQAYEKKPADWDDYVHMRESGDFYRRVYRDNVETVFHGAVVRTNRWGMRDRDRELAKRPQSQRIALIGSSHTAGSGVANEETFGARIEEALNAEGCGDGDRDYEVLNFAVSGHATFHHPSWVETRAVRFAPDVLIFVAHPRDAERIDRELGRTLFDGNELPDPELRALVEGVGIRPGMTITEMRMRLRPAVNEILASSYERIVRTSREHRIRPIWVLLPKTTERLRPEDVAEEFELAREAGFEVLSLLDVYDGHRPLDLAVAEWDMHPNADAHRLVAERLYELLCSAEDALLRKRGEAVAANPGR